MNKFAYKGNSPSGMTSGVIEALNAQAANTLLRARGVTPFSITPANQSSHPSETTFDLTAFIFRISLKELIMFTRQMYTLMHSGVPIGQSLDGLANNQHNAQFKKVIMDIHNDIESGHSLHQAMKNQSHVFDELYVSLIEVGENTGRLDISFEQAGFYLEREHETRQQIKAATRYPVVVLATLAIALVIINVFVIPQFSKIFESFNADLPLPTQIIIGTSHFFTNYWYVLIIGIVLTVLGTQQYLKNPAGLRQWDYIKLKLPIIGSIFFQATLGRFARTLGIMTQAGLPILKSLDLIKLSIGNAYISHRLGTVIEDTKSGLPLATATKNSGLFTPLVCQMFQVGEDSGRLDSLMNDVATFYEREVDYELKRFSSAIEPIMIILIAGMVLILALGVFLPLWDLSSHITR